MKFPRPSQEEISVNLTPLIDVVFLLLIFFMVSTTFDDKTQLSITLPEADAAPLAQSSDQVEVTITSTGDYLVNGEKLAASDSKTLRTALLKLGQEKTDLPLQIYADANVAISRWFAFMTWPDSWVLLSCRSLLANLPTRHNESILCGRVADL